METEKAAGGTFEAHCDGEINEGAEKPTQKRRMNYENLLCLL